MQTDKWTSGKVDRQTNGQHIRQTGIKMDKQIKQTDREIRKMDIEIEKKDKAYRQTNKTQNKKD